MNKILSLLGITFVAALSLTGCSAKEAVPLPGDVGEQGEIYAGFSVVETPFIGSLNNTTGFPYVKEVSKVGFVLVDGGSSSCPNIIQTVAIYENENRVDVSYAEPDGDVPCTDDFGVKESTVEFNDLALSDSSEIMVTLGGAAVPTLTSGN